MVRTWDPGRIEHPVALADDLDDLRSKARIHLPEDLFARMEAARTTLVGSGLVESALGVGDDAPAFSLPDANGTTVTLGDHLARGPVVVAFYRGGWCPYCNVELRALQAALETITESGGSLIAISPQTPDASLTTAEKDGLTFDVLSDVGNVVARSFGLVFTIADDLRPMYGADALDLASYNGDDSYELPIPATYVIDRAGTIQWASVDADYTHRAEPSDVAAAIRALGQAAPISQVTPRSTGGR